MCFVLAILSDDDDDVDDEIDDAAGAGSQVDADNSSIAR